MCLKVKAGGCGKDMTGIVNENQIVLGTSLAPSNLEKQRNAVRSWIESGFYVVSCNTKEEIDVLKSAFSDIPVEFVEVQRTAESICGKKLPYVQTILDVVGSMSKGICGFINSDILFSHMPAGMYHFIAEEAVNSLVFGRRNEIDKYSDINDLNWDINFDGIDFFFLDVCLVPDFFDDGFYMQSGWDLCVLIKCKILGITIKELINPIAFHLRHKIEWNFRETGVLVKNFMEKYFNIHENTYRYASDLFYEILYNDCRKICFCNEQQYESLFVLHSGNEATINSIENQNYISKEICYSDEEKNRFDYVFYVSDGLQLSHIFCRAAIFLMEEFDCGELNIGSFFVSEKRGKIYYNQLSRNLNIVKKMNAESNRFTKVIRKGGSKSGTVFLPIAFETISEEDREIKNFCSVDAKMYVMPAGVRGSEWFVTNKDNFKGKLLGYIDNDKVKVGNLINGIPVYSVDVLQENHEDVYVIVISKYYSEEIEEQLASIIDRDKIINAYYIFSVMQDAYMDYFSLEKYIENRREK